MRRDYLNKPNSGQAMIIATILFLIVSVIIIFGLADPLTRQQRMVSAAMFSRQSFFAAEAGVEEVVFRLKTGKQISSAETFELNGGTVSVSVSDTLLGKDVIATGTVSNLVRKIRARVLIGEGIAFNYGIQTGTGGMTLNNNAGVAGNVYTNGPISGANGAFITGSAIASGTTTINRVLIGNGSTDDAWADRVTNSTVAGSLFCQTGSGNNKPCDTLKLDPPPQNFPLTNEKIEEWKTQTGGQTFTGTKTIDDQTVSLGPIKIVGNLVVTNGAVLTVTGTIWVTGDITLSNSSRVQLDSGYGGAGGLIIADGKISISNKAVLAGSGGSSSYILAISTSGCPTGDSCGGSSAINVDNNAGTVILNAQNGVISFGNGAGAKAVVAKTLTLQNNAVITYESGLLNSQFSSGPGGGYTIKDWQEVE